MWMVDYDHELVQVTVLYDLTEKKVTSFTRESGRGSYSSAHSGAHFFNTKHEAEAWLSKHRAKLRELMPKVYNFLLEMSNLNPNEDFDYKRSDYLPDYYQNEDDYYQRRYYAREKVLNILTNYCRQQKLCISGVTFPLSYVRRVNWCRDKAELVLSDGSFGGISTVTTNGTEEYEVVKILFGENTSGMQFKR